MSGIAGHLCAGGPASADLVRSMVDGMAARGPDAGGVHAEGSVALGCALLRSTRESADEVQPASLDGRTWAVGDLRIDDRARLVEELKAAGRPTSTAAPDLELVLHAWATWGERCVERLLGDFVFAVWDSGGRRLFAARDQWGIKPLFYFHRPGRELAFASDLDALRLHPEVSDQLDDRAIADYLLFGHTLDLDVTAFADARRLPPAHWLSWSEGRLEVRRYWELPVEEPLRLRREEEYVERLSGLLEVAVEDRLRTDRVGVRMSGGLDSTAIAAVAQERLCVTGRPFELRAYTTVFDWLIPDDEADYARPAAERLGIPQHFHIEDEYPPLEGGRMPPTPTPEPEETLMSGSEEALLQDVAERRIRVLLCGIGGDETMKVPRSYILWILRHRAFGRLIADVSLHLARHRRLPGLGIRTALRDRRETEAGWPFPEWIDPGLAERLDLRERWRRARRRPRVHPVHPESYYALTSPLFSTTLEAFDPGRRGYPAEHRFPFLDLRLVRFLLRVPVRYGWGQKRLLREAMRGRLPEIVRRRPKSPLAGDQLSAWTRQADPGWSRVEGRSELLSWYVRDGHIPPLACRGDFLILWSDFRVLALNRWLLGQRPEPGGGRLGLGETP